jgi:hypothetical protein
MPMTNPTGESENGPLRLGFDHRLKLDFHGCKVTSDAGLLAHRELDDALGLTNTVGDALVEPRTGKNGQHAMKWTRLSCCSFAANAVRLQLHALAYNLGNFLRTLALPEAVAHWSLTSLKEKLIKIGAKVVRHARYVIFQMAEVAVPRGLFSDIPRLIALLRAPPAPA